MPRRGPRPTSDCEAKGAIERYHKTWRAEVGCELPDSPLTLAERHIAWITREYNRRVHGGTIDAMRAAPPTRTRGADNLLAVVRALVRRRHLAADRGCPGAPGD